MNFLKKVFAPPRRHELPLLKKGSGTIACILLAVLGWEFITGFTRSYLYYFASVVVAYLLINSRVIESRFRQDVSKKD